MTSTASKRNPMESDDLLAAYLRCLDAVEAVPVFSLWPYLRLYIELVLWEFSLIGVPFAAAIDLLLLVPRLFGVKPFPSLARRLLRYAGRPFRGIWAGDLSGLRVTRIRSLTSAFIAAHVTNRIDALNLAIDRERMELLLQPSEAEAQMQRLDLQQKKLQALATLAKAPNPLRALLATGTASALPLGFVKLLIPPIIGLLPSDIADQIGSFVLLGKSLQVTEIPTESSLLASPYLLPVAGGFFVFLLACLMSGAIDTRIILAETSTTELERASNMESMEVPWDALFFGAAAIVGVLCHAIYAGATLPEPDRTDAIETDWSELAFFIGIVVIVIARRWYLARAARMGTDRWMTVLRSALWPGGDKNSRYRSSHL